MRPFSDPDRTATGETRATVPFAGLRTLWFNTGTLCNVTCAGCYIESSPTNDRLAYLGRDEVRTILDEAAAQHASLREVAFTGGEPFMNRDLPGMIRDALSAGYRVLVLTNAMRPMRRFEAELEALRADFPGRLTLRMSLDHYSADLHESLRGDGSWAAAIDGLRWLARAGFDLAIAGRTLWDEDEAALREGYGALFAELGLTLDPQDPAQLVLFPEMEQQRRVPEITEQCWGILGKQPGQMMCADQRMVVKRRGAEKPVVVSCTLLPYDAQFELGDTLAAAARTVKLNHRYCAEFCVLGGGSCRAA
ncbi:radical SAM protein [Lichenicoccus sp.]|uniref:radical SAM protein n=1 Tax=Lichenicoccus sp. TaxID=2781899 RepID=UPI003D113264